MRKISFFQTSTDIIRCDNIELFWPIVDKIPVQKIFLFGDTCKAERKWLPLFYKSVPVETIYKKLDHTIQFEHLLKKALRSLTFHIQPIVKTENETILGHESLLRFSPTIPYFSPELLIACVVQRRFIHYLDLKSLRSSFANPALSKKGLVFVNLHPYSLLYPHFLNSVHSLVERYDVQPSNYVLEITEQDSFFRIPNFTQKIKKLRSFGFKIALDDFGFGLSNYWLLGQIEPDFLKIAGELADNIDLPLFHNSIQSIINFAKKSNMTAILERIETKKQLHSALALRVPYAQGYYFKKPMPYDAND